MEKEGHFDAEWWGHLRAELGGHCPRILHIDNSTIFPTSAKGCSKARNIFINDREIRDIAGKYLSVFDYDEPLPEVWRAILPFKDKLELHDYLTILTRIVEQTEEENEVVNRTDRRRIGLIFNKLTSLLPDCSENNKNEIKDWAQNNKLLSTTGEFENAGELKWIKIDGFKFSTEKLKIIQLPENCETNSKAFEELISLFQVAIIDKFTPTFENLNKDFDLKNKLQNILPYFVSIMERKQYADFSKEFERLFLIVGSSDFFNAAEIKLSFTYLNDTIEGASLNVFREQNALYYKGKWRSPVTMFTLIPELSALLDVSGLNDELRLLLQSDESDIVEWLVGLGYNISGIKMKPEYQKAKQKIKTEQQKLKVTAIAAEAEEEGSESAEVESKNGVNADSGSVLDSFNPSSSPKELDVTKISVTKKIYTTTNQIAESNYAKIESQEIREDVGLWSEEFVFEFLTKNSTIYSDIIWENQNGESGKPYDFKVKENGQEKFFDAKGTPSGSKDIVYLSPAEWIFMFDKCESYSLFRVYNAGKNDARIEIIENPSELLMLGKIFPNPITIQV